MQLSFQPWFFDYFIVECEILYLKATLYMSSTWKSGEWAYLLLTVTDHEGTGAEGTVLVIDIRRDDVMVVLGFPRTFLFVLLVLGVENSVGMLVEPL